MTISAFQDYLAKIEVDYRRGIATEHTYRSTLETLIEALATGIDASNDPQHIACGAPDFIVERRKIPLGYIETKDIGVDLDKIEKTEQLKRYLKALNNLILTDYLEFRWYVRGVLRLKARVAEEGATGRGRLQANPEGMALAEQMFNQFLQTETPTVTSAKELAIRLAEQTHLVRDLIVNALSSSGDSEHSALDKQYKTFCEYLIPTLKPAEFADLYAQTMAYGLFAAKLSAPENAPFSRAAAYQYLSANKFLRRLFLDVGEELDGTLIAPFLDDIAALLAHADFASILSDFGKRTRTEDPVVHFYETFLSAYDPKLRESRGVYYTPEPVVQFIVNSVDWLLKNRFGKAWGLADENVKILDPATGTATFLYYVIQKIHEEVIERGQAGTWQEKSKELLRRVFGFELLMAPYVVSHLKLGLLMQELGTPLTKNERLQVFLTNTLEEGVTRAETIEGLDYYIAEEASQAARVKKQEDIMVVLGNPPYSNFGMMNKGKWITDLLEDYKIDLNEKKTNIDDDYIKFIRFGQWRISKSKQGILAFITNHSFLAGLTHRRMRKTLLESFSDIFILNLHGNSNIKEIAPNGIRDENVFDIQQGVSINIMVRQPNHKGLGKVHYFELWGNRESKYTYLSSTKFENTAWIELVDIERSSCLGKFWFFTPKDYENIDDYCLGWSVIDMFNNQNTGIQTKRDELFIDFDKTVLAKRFQDIAEHSNDFEYLKSRYSLENSSGWSVNKLGNLKYSPSLIDQILYRPFDTRWIYFDPKALGRAREKTMRHMIVGENLGMVTLRINGSEDDFVMMAVENLVEKGSLPRGNYSLFPLYLYTTYEETKGTLFAQIDTTRKPNFNPKFIEACEAKLGLRFILDGKGDGKSTFGPEDVFHYAYAVFHNPTYRKRYAEFLKIDFPRLPLTSDKKLFAKLAMKGEELVGLHLLKSAKVNDLISSYPVAGDNAVDKVRYAKGKVWINNSQYFGGVPEPVWEFKVGGYQVCEKWLKDRKGRTLSGEDISHYQRVLVALKETRRLMDEIDKAIGKWPME